MIAPRKTAEDHGDKIAYRMREAERACGISKAKLYELIASGELKSVKRAGRRLIMRADLEAFLRGTNKQAA
jgi:excisionase family DNA binding protein